MNKKKKFSLKKLLHNSFDDNPQKKNAKITLFLKYNLASAVYIFASIPTYSSKSLFKSDLA